MLEAVYTDLIVRMVNKVTMIVAFDLAIELYYLVNSSLGHYTKAFCVCFLALFYAAQTVTNQNLIILMSLCNTNFIFINNQFQSFCNIQYYYLIIKLRKFLKHSFVSSLVIAFFVRRRL